MADLDRAVTVGSAEALLARALRKIARRDAASFASAVEDLGKACGYTGFHIG